jgi:hypothetical protein
VSATRAIRRIVGLGDVVQEFGSIGGPVAWSPDGARICVEQVDRTGLHTVSLVATRDWTRIAEIPASRPVWSPDGALIAVVRPFARSIPPPPETTVVVLDGLTGNERESFPLRATALGWAGGELHGLVDGRLAPVRDPSQTKATCVGGCELAYWAPGGGFVALGGGEEHSEFALKRFAPSPTDPEQESLGEARSLTWAAKVPALAWLGSSGVMARKEGAGRTQVTVPAGYRPVVWSPHGEILVCGQAGGNGQTGGNWKQWQAATSQIENLTLPPDLGISSFLSWSPDAAFMAGVPFALSSARFRIYRVVAEAA